MAQSKKNRPKRRRMQRSPSMEAQLVKFIKRRKAFDKFNPGQESLLRFNNQNLQWEQNGEVINSWPAISGRSGYQSPAFQSAVDLGPVPSGVWRLKQDQLQNIDDLPTRERVKTMASMASAMAGKKTSAWPGGDFSWGKHRIWLQPLPGTNTFGRSNMAIHGGNAPGSAGCIDLTCHMNDFTSWFRAYGRDMDVIVDYGE